MSLNPTVYNEFMTLDCSGKCQATYVWLGGDAWDIRSKCRTLDSKEMDPSKLPEWNFDGSSCGQAPGDDSEVILRPQAVYRDPFNGGDAILVMCDCYKPDGTPIVQNTRVACAAAMDAAKDEEPWFGCEQEYTLFELDGVTPLGWPKNGFPGPQGPYYCGAGAENSFGRQVMDAHYKCCLYAGITISGTNGEVMPGQWEYQVGPCPGISEGDELWMSRYLMMRVCEALQVRVSFDPKPIEGDWNGAGTHTNFSTKATRAPGGYKAIVEQCEKLGAKHAEHVAAYGEGNERRLTGKHETCDIDTFKYGVANRGASIRIPRDAEKNQCGYYEDRRPASNMDPYIVCGKIVQTTLLD